MRVKWNYLTSSKFPANAIRNIKGNIAGFLIFIIQYYFIYLLLLLLLFFFDMSVTSNLTVTSGCEQSHTSGGRRKSRGESKDQSHACADVHFFTSVPSCITG